MPTVLPTRIVADKIIAPPAGEFRLSGWHVLAMLVAFFGVIAAVNAVMMTMAIRTMPGLEVKSAYEASQRFNSGLDSIAAQDQRGWKVEISSGGITKGAPLGVSLRDASGMPVKGLAGEARFERPTDKRMDRPFALRETGEGIYEADIPLLEAGQWDLAVELLRDHQRVFVSRRRIVLAR